ncbi:MAG: hypothetical protein KKE44_11540 [Proteobacteria bacterium]|nr:hypothetical protein [Pseudomonadota bacterium]MBU1583356.1 hypothetical protein [Pseudomonadota bacterium]MBU2453140.1 hypothetical protein [Pseudomonadota bacterium]MBU2627844.1 hypothetical protein [Pseudomonadota bacterium]
MDKNFLEFWGNMMLNAAKGQKQMDEMAKWVAAGLSGMKEMNDLFFKPYGIKPVQTEKKDNYHDADSIQKKAFSSFLSSFEEYLSLFDVVPKKKHMEMVHRYETLKQRVKDQEETITHLQMMMEDVGHKKNDVTQKLNTVISLQTTRFNKLLEEFGSMTGVIAMPEKKKTVSRPNSARKKTPVQKKSTKAKILPK